jgi:type II secretory pathway component GspD/PulD (secretin)
MKTGGLMLVVLAALILTSAGPVRGEPFGHDPGFDRRITVSFRDADVNDVLKAFSDDYGINLVLEDGIQGKITANFHQVPVGDALDAVLATVGCGWEERRGIVVVFQSKPIRKVLDVNYTMGDRFREEIQVLLSDEGSLVFDPASSNLMVIDRPRHVEMVESFLGMARPERRQVMIEARIVEVTLDQDDELGINWDWSDLSFLGANDISAEAIQTLAPEAAGGGEETGWQGFQFALSHQKASFLLQAIAKHTNVDLLSAPKIATLNNRKAVIQVTEKIPYVKTSTDIAEAGFISTKEEVEFEEVGITLEATPQIAPDGGVFLTIRPEVSEVTQWFNGQPVVDRRSVETSIRIGDGETIIIGGLLRDATTQTIRKVPILGDIPGLGLLLRHKSEVQKKSELMILISPHIATSEVAASEIEEGEERQESMRRRIKPGLLR